MSDSMRLVVMMTWAAETLFGGLGMFFWLLSSFYPACLYAQATLFLIIAVAFHHALFPEESTENR